MECVESVLQTNYERFEIIIVDNASKDNSVSICKEKFKEIQIIENHTNFYMKDIFTGKDKGIMLEFYEIVQKNSKLKAYLKAKIVPMIVKKTTLEGYMESRKNLISALEESLN